MITLRGITWEHARGFGSVSAAAKSYNLLQNNVCVEWDYRSLQAFADEPLEGLARDYDLLIIDHPHVALAAERGLLRPLDEWIDGAALQLLSSQSVGKSHDSYRHAGHQWGLATDAAAQVSVRRPDLLTSPPRDWGEVIELARDGRVLWAAKPIDSFSSLLTLLANNGSPAFGGEANFASADDMAWPLEIMHTLAEHVPDQCLRWNPIDVAEALAGDDEFLYSPLGFGYVTYSQAGYRRRRLQYQDIPRGREGVAGALLGGAGIAVSAWTTAPDEAAAHAAWLATPEVQSKVYFDGGGQPGNAASWDDERLNSLTLDFFTGTRATLEAAYVRPRHSKFIAFQDAASPLVTAALSKDISDCDLIRKLNALAGELRDDVSTLDDDTHASDTEREARVE